MQIDCLSKKVVDVFNKLNLEISSDENHYHSDQVLSILEHDLCSIGFSVEKSKCKNDKIRVPVLYGLNGKPEKSFDADAYSSEFGYVIEVEAGRAVVNYQFLKDFFEACVMCNVNNLCIAVRNKYKKSNDFEKVCLFFDTLYQSGRIGIPINGLLIIGY